MGLAIATIFFGYFGVYRFARKQYALGILYLLTFGLFGFGWMYDIYCAFKTMPGMDPHSKIPVAFPTIFFILLASTTIAHRRADEAENMLLNEPVYTPPATVDRSIPNIEPVTEPITQLIPEPTTELVTEPPTAPTTLAPVTYRTAPAQQKNDSQIIVYIGETGTKYHYQDCRTLKNGATAITLAQAKAQGRTSCGVCHSGRIG